MIRGSNLSRGREFFSSPPLCPDWFWGPPSLLSNGARSLGVKRQWREADHLHPSSAEVKNAWIYTSTRTYPFIGAGSAQWYSAGLGAGWSEVRVPVGGGNFSLHNRCVHTGSESHPASYPMGTRGSFHAGNVTVAGSWLPPPSSAEVKKAWSYTSTPTYTFIGAEIAQWYSARLRTGWSGVRVPVGAGKFSSHHRVQTGSGAHPVSYPVGTRGSFPGDKATVAWSWPPPPSSADVKNAWSYTSTLPIRLHGVVLS
jgi:hypothetical protein